MSDYKNTTMEYGAGIASQYSG